MNLKEVVQELYESSQGADIRALSAIAQAELFLQQAYEGRYFFELIQNVRDANKEQEQDGEIIIELVGKQLKVSNTGAEFNQSGIEGITTIGQSPKNSQDFIGFKGIGFKSVQEVTETPKIITKYGSVHFDRELTLKTYPNVALKKTQTPLFYFPHFNEATLSIEETEKGIVTKIELPLKESVSEARIIADFAKIQSKQLILLGNIETLQFLTNTTSILFTIKKNLQKRYIEVVKNDTEIHKFRFFSPSNKIQIPVEIVEDLEGKEKEIFSNNSSVDINIVFELADNGQIISVEDAKLYLFYPLQISSGFRFLIHSYFIVDPERKSLRDSPLNSFLLKSIAEYIGHEMLQHLKDRRSNTTRILCFKRNKDAKLENLYDNLVEILKKKKFIFDSKSQKYFFHNEVIVADGFDKGLFPDGKLGNKQLIYTDDKDVIGWLQQEFNVHYLSFDDIAQEIEKECKKQQRQKNVKFFQNLYNYVTQYEGINLTGKKVLLTDDWKLVSSDEDVFYGGSRKNQIQLPKGIKNQIHFIHRDIKITDFREGKSRTGISEFNTYELVKRLLKLFNNPPASNIDVLNVLLKLELDNKSELEIKEKILFPIIGSLKWLSPISNAIYFVTENLKELYPNGNFIDESNLKINENSPSESVIKDFLIKFGIWDIPAIYISAKYTRVNSKDGRDKMLGSYSGLSSRPFHINNDRILDKPEKYNYWFTTAIIDNWSRYKAFIKSSSNPRIQYYSQQSTPKYAGDEMTLQLSDFTESLTTQKWVVFKGEDKSYSVSDIVGIKHLDFVQGHNYVIKRFLKLLPISFELKKDFIETIGLVHLDGNSIANYIKLLKIIYKKFQQTQLEEGFTDFYNRILSKLVDFFYDNDQTDKISLFSSEYFLAVDETSKQLCWAMAKDIYYIDDKPNYDLLPTSIKKAIQPHFTNRDRNTFGKIAGRIGKKFSNSVHKKLIFSEANHSDLLINYFSFLPEAIAILETSLDIVLSNHFEKIRAIRVYEKETLQINISIGDSNIEVPVNYFIDNDSKFDIHLSTSFSENRNRQIADAISELFINLLERDLRKYGSDLFRFLNTSDKPDYLNDYDISNQRIGEIRDKLNSSDFTPNQKFWDAILAIKDINSRENIFVEKKIDAAKLSNSIDVPEELILNFENGFNFIETSTVSNIPLLEQLFSFSSINLAQVNTFIFPKIDFTDYYTKRLKIVKNRFENGFNSLLFQYLANKSINEQEKYQDYLDDFKNFSISVPFNTIGLNVEECFLKAVRSRFNFLTSVNLSADYSSFTPAHTYTICYEALKESLKPLKYNGGTLESFLSLNKRRSLLYFGQIETLSKEFTEWHREHLKPTSTDNEEDLSDILKEFSYQTDEDIEDVIIGNVGMLGNGNGNVRGSNGGRYDGGAGDQHKKLIGLIAEMRVFEKLKTKYEHVVWVSKFASKVKGHIGYNPEGQDGLGYDIEYLDNEGNKVFVEVKGRSDDYEAFEITKPEIDKAHQSSEFYKLIFVTNVMDNSNRRIRNLGNIFLLEDGQDFFKNDTFTVIYKSFEIRFQEQ